MSIDVAYYSFNPDRADKIWNQIEANQSYESALKFIKGDWNRENISKITSDNSDSRYLVRDLDFDFGALYADFRDFSRHYEPVLEVFGMGAIQDNLGFINGTKEWIELYQSITPELLNDRSKEMAQLWDWPVEDCEDLIRDFFIGMKPLVNDAKNNSTSILMKDSSVCGVEPPEVENLLKEREQKHLELCLHINTNK